MASRNCCKVQAAVGWAVRLQCRMRRLPTSITTNTYSTRKPTVMATKKSEATMALAWLRTNVRHCCEDVLLPPLGSLSCGQYARTVRGETKIPSFTDSSAAMRSSPQVGFSCTMRTISWRRFSGIRGLPNRDFLRQNSLNPWRCQPKKGFRVKKKKNKPLFINNTNKKQKKK